MTEPSKATSAQGHGGKDPAPPPRPTQGWLTINPNSGSGGSTGDLGTLPVKPVRA